MATAARVFDAGGFFMAAPAGGEGRAAPIEVLQDVDRSKRSGNLANHKAHSTENGCATLLKSNFKSQPETEGEGLQIVRTVGLTIKQTPVECARSVETTRRSALADAADYGYCASHSRFFWGFRLHGLFAPDGTPRALSLCSPKRTERTVALELIERIGRGGEIVIGDKGYAGAQFEDAARALGAHVVRPSRKDEDRKGPHIAPIRQRIESIFWTFKDILTLERHGARTLHGLRTRLCARFLGLAAAIALNHQLGRPSRALVDYVA